MDPKSGVAHTKYKGDFTEAWVYFTTSGGQWQARKWNFIQCNVSKEELVARQPLPKGTTAFLVYVFKDVGGYRSNHACSEVIVAKP